MKKVSAIFIAALILIPALFLNAPLYAQFRTEIFGTPAAGSILIGRGEQIKSVLFDKKNVAVNKEGWFIVGFDRDAKGKFQLKVTYKDKKTETFEYEVDPGVYEVQKISGLSRQMVTPPKKFRARISRESKIIAAQKKKLLTDKSSSFESGFIVPVDSSEITSVFGSGRVLNGKKKNPHNGIDYGADEGEPVRASGDGTVILAENNFYYNGTFVMISHGMGLHTIYLHLSRLHLKRGDKVKKGDLIGEVGSTGRSTGPHLHFGLQLFQKRIDPMVLFELNLPVKESIKE